MKKISLVELLSLIVNYIKVYKKKKELSIHSFKYFILSDDNTY
jgi:hypothetical protein